MFDDLRRAFQEAVANFRHELHRDEVPRKTDDLLRRMQGEAERRRAENHRIRAEIRRALKEAEGEEERRATCRRREVLARDVEDHETARLAADYAARHEERRDVLQRKALALRDELRVREREMKEMEERLTEARTRRDDLAARAGRTQARETFREADALLDDLDRLADRVEEMEDRAAASEEMSALAEELDGASGPETAHRRTSGTGAARDAAAEGPGGPTDGDDPDAHLRELKRRMEEE